MKNTQDEFVIETYPQAAKSLRISIVTETFPPEVNGVAMTLGRLVDGLMQQGHQVQVVRPRQKTENGEGAAVGFEQILAMGLPLPAYGDLRFGLPAKQRLKKLWTLNRPDVVHVVTEGPLGWSAVTAARKLGLPVTSSFHTNFQSYSQNYGVGLLKSPIDAYLRKLHNRTLATLVPTREVAVDLVKRGYRHVQVMARGVDTQLFSPDRRSQALRSVWGAGPTDPVVILVGRLAKEKNVGLVVAAFRSIQQRHPGAKLVFVGDGPLKASLQELCPDAIFRGIRRGEDLAVHYASGDLFLFPSLTETYGNVVPEALASGLAVLAYQTAAAAELIVGNENGVVIESGDEVAFVARSVELASNLAAMHALRLKACASVQHLRWEAIVERFVQVLKDATAQNQLDLQGAGSVGSSRFSRQPHEHLPHSNTTA